MVFMCNLSLDMSIFCEKKEEEKMQLSKVDSNLSRPIIIFFQILLQYECNYLRSKLCSIVCHLCTMAIEYLEHCVQISLYVTKQEWKFQSGHPFGMQGDKQRFSRFRKQNSDQVQSSLRLLKKPKWVELNRHS